MEPSARAAEGIVLAQDLAGKEGQHSAELAAGDGPLTLAAAPGLMVPRRFSSIFSMAGLSMTAKLCVLALDQEARSTTRTVGVAQVPGGIKAGDVMDVRHGSVRQSAQLVDGVADLGGAQDRARRESGGLPWTRRGPS